MENIKTAVLMRPATHHANYAYEYSTFHLRVP